MVGLHFSVLVIIYYLCTIKHYDSIKVISDTYFDVETDVKDLRDAMDFWGTNEKMIIDIIGSRSLVQRREIVDKYKSCYGEDLEKRLESELSGNFRSTVLALMMPLPDFYAQEMHHAIAGWGTQEDVLVEILGTLSNKDILAVSESYKRMYKKNMENAIDNDTSGHFRSLCVSLLMGKRDESSDVNEYIVLSDAASLNKAGKQPRSTNQAEFHRILVTRSYAHLKRVFEVYKQLSSEDIEIAIKKEFTDDTLMGLLSIVQIIRYKEEYFAERLLKTMVGAGTDDRTLIRIVVTRSEIDIQGIKEAYNKKFNKGLDESIERDAMKYYRRLLLDIIL